MTEPVAKAKSAVSSVEDLSKEIEKSMDRRPDDRIKVVRLFDDYYRCNWWVQDKSPHPFWLMTGIGTHWL